MPQISRQTIKPAPKPVTRTVVTRNGLIQPSVLSEAIPVGEMQDDWLKICIYGENRTGKTTLACEFEKPLLLVALEPNQTGGAKSVKKVEGVTYLRLTTTEKVVRLAEELKTNNPFKTIVLDSVTSFQDMVLKEIMNLPAIPDQMSWGMVDDDGYRQRSEKTREGLRPYINLPCHLVICAKQRDHNAMKGDRRPKLIRSLEIESFFGVDLGGATAGWLHDTCDYLARLYIDKEVVRTVSKSPIKGIAQEIETFRETGKLVRRLQTMYHPNYAAGFRSENPQAVPEFIEAKTPTEMYEKMMSVIRGEPI